MKVLMLNGSPKADGNTAAALQEMTAIFAQEGIEVDLVQVGSLSVRGCIGCGTCYKTKRCVFDDIVNELAVKLEQADGLVLGSPVYYASANSTLTAVLDRLFYSTRYPKTMKVGASVAVARRGGCSATFDQLNKYFTISGMPIASSYYWNGVHGKSYDEASEDLEGLETMHSLGENMAFLLKAIRDAKEKYGTPKRPKKVYTNFIR